jgi:hypothetical protein
MTPYKQGFIDKCAELEIDPNKLIKFSQEVEEAKKKKKRKSMHPALKALIGAGVLGGGAYAGYRLAPDETKENLRRVMRSIKNVFSKTDDGYPADYKQITDPGGRHINPDADEIAARLKEDLKPTDTGGRHLPPLPPVEQLDTESLGWDENDRFKRDIVHKLREPGLSDYSQRVLHEMFNTKKPSPHRPSWLDPIPAM